MKKMYVVIAHCLDGDFIIGHEGFPYFNTFNDALEARWDHEGMGADIEIRIVK